MFFESKHSIDQNEFYIRHGEAISFPIHLHRAFECFVQTEGRTLITIDGKEYELNPSDAVLIFPYQVHSYQKIEKGKYSILIFAPEIVAEFAKKTNKKLPANNLFHYEIKSLDEPSNLFLQKSQCYEICGVFDKECEYFKQAESAGDDIIKELLLFIENNFRAECSLKSAAYATGYDYAYISKLFKRRLGIPFKKYVNMLRINEGKQLLISTSKGIMEIMEECGFSCLRTFNREFKELTKSTPTEYRLKHSEASTSAPKI